MLLGDECVVFKLKGEISDDSAHLNTLIEPYVRFLLVYKDRPAHNFAESAGISKRFNSVISG